MPADPAKTLIPRATAPFACAPTKGGVYVDTTCAQVCVCVSADGKWARSDTGVEGSATDCCLPPTTTTTTTTLPILAAPSWIPSSLATWRLDEASGTRVNAQGTTARDLAVSGGALANDTTDKMEGTASVVFTGTQTLGVTETALSNMTAFTTGCWVKLPDTWQSVIRQGDGSNGLELDHLSGNSRLWLYLAGAQPTVQAAEAANTWRHVVATFGTRTMRLYHNGAQVATGSTVNDLTAAMPGPFTLSSSFHPMSGRLDECFVVGQVLAASSICRICSCGMDGALCQCTGTSFTTTGRNATACGSCTLPADCSAAAPS